MRIAFAVLSLLVLVACTADVAVRPIKPQARVVIDAGSGGFCPPGQAKKGRC